MAFFAANSLLARRALRGGEIDAGTFTAIRIVSAAAALLLLTSFGQKGVGAVRSHGSWRAAFALFTYAASFSVAYLTLNAATGALVLFAAVQFTMLSIGIARGERPRLLDWVGLIVAFAGLIYLVSPGLAAPSPIGVGSMVLSGAAWGYYSLAARDVRSSLAATAGNFIRGVPLALAALAAASVLGPLHATWSGILLAGVSGVIASGLGYALWYVALNDLRTSLAAVVQLTVPVLAAAAGVLLLNEQLTWRLSAASAAILGGVALSLFSDKID